METANATRPKFGEPWGLDGDNLIADRDGDGYLIDELLNAPRIVACVNALAGIANPSAIHALIQAARYVVTIRHGSVFATDVAIVQLATALHALDAEPVA